MPEPTSCCAGPESYCARVDAMFNMPGVHVIDVAWRVVEGRGRDRLVLTVETHPGACGLPTVRGARNRTRPPAAAAARHPGVRGAGRTDLAQPPLPLPRGRLLDG